MKIFLMAVWIAGAQAIPAEVQTKVEVSSHKLEEVIRVAVVGDFPPVISVTRIGGPSITVVSPLTRVAIAAVEAEEEGRDFKAANVTSEMLATIEIEVTPPRRSPEATKSKERDSKFNALDVCVEVAQWPTITNVARAFVVTHDETLIPPTTADEVEPYDADSGVGIRARFPLDVVQRGNVLRIALSSGHWFTFQLDPNWIQ